MTFIASLQEPNTSTQASIAANRYKVQNRFLAAAQHIITAVLLPTWTSEPKRAFAHSTRQHKASKVEAITLGWLPLLTLLSSLGVFVVAYAYNIARDNVPGADFFFWSGLLLIFVPVLARVISSAASRFERIGLLCVDAICLYLVKVILSPLYFSGYDEFLHWRSANDIASSGHLFTPNPLLPVSPFYPGLEIVTNALSRLSGLNTFTAGIVVVGVAHLIMILSIFMLSEQITKSARIAGIAAMLYMANPHFLFFDAQFAYESLALPLAIFVLFAVARHETLTVKSERRWMMLTAWVVLGAVIMTHHVTGFILDGLLMLWTVVYAFLQPTSVLRSGVARTALVGMCLTAVSLALVGKILIPYLSSFGTDTLSQFGQMLVHNNGTRHLFVDYGGQPTPLWERLMSLSSVALISLSLPFGLLCIWKRYRTNALVSMFGLVSLSYLLIQVLRLTDSGAEASDRASAFIFIPLSCVSAILIAQFWSIRWLSRKSTSSVTCAIAVVFLGGVVLGNGSSSSLLPGPYQVSADARSIEPEGIQAALWARSYLGPDNPMATDRVNTLLMGTYGDQHLVTSGGNNIDVTDVFFSTSFDSYETSLLQRAKVRYLVVDLRLSTALPLVGYYFEQGEAGSFERTTPMELEALTKFDMVPQINRVFDSGNIVIYDTGGLIKPQVPVPLEPLLPKPR